MTVLKTLIQVQGMIIVVLGPNMSLITCKLQRQLVLDIGFGVCKYFKRQICNISFYLFSLIGGGLLSIPWSHMQYVTEAGNFMVKVTSEV